MYMYIKANAATQLTFILLSSLLVKEFKFQRGFKTKLNWHPGDFKLITEDRMNM